MDEPGVVPVEGFTDAFDDGFAIVWTEVTADELDDEFPAVLVEGLAGAVCGMVNFCLAGVDDMDPVDGVVSADGVVNDDCGDEGCWEAEAGKALLRQLHCCGTGMSGNRKETPTQAKRVYRLSRKKVPFCRSAL